MKRSVRAGVGAILLAWAAWTPTAKAATEPKKSAAIQQGLAYLYSTQQAAGYWKASGYEHAATGAAAFAFLSQQDKWGSNTAVYQAAVDKAIAYLVSTAYSVDVNTRNDGVNICLGGSTSCKAVYWYDAADPTYSMYTTGLVAPAIAAYSTKGGATKVATTRGPLAGMTWGQIAQGITNAFAASQSTSGNGNRDGGWHGFPGNGDSDSSTIQSAIIALLYDETLGAITPQALKDELKIWLGNVQNASGAVCFQPGTEPCDHANTGAWLLAMRFVSYDLTNSQVQAALSFLNSNWQLTANNVWYGNFGHPYAMWSVYFGLEATIGLKETTYITKLLTDCGASTNESPDSSGGATRCSWSEDYNEWLAKNQNVDGSWIGYSSWTAPIATAFFVDILGGVQIPSLPQNGTSEITARPSQDQPALASGLQNSIALRPLAASKATQANANSAASIHAHVRKGVTAVALTADGTTLASASNDKNIRLWSPTTGQQRLVLQGSLGLPTGLAFSPGGSMLSSVGTDSLVRIWDAASGKQLANLAGHEQAIRGVAVSPDGKFLASAGEGTRVLLWDLSSRKLSRVLYGPTDFVNAVSFSPDGRLLAVGGDDARVLIFDVASGKNLYTLRGHSGAVNAVAFSPDGTVLASGGDDTVIHLWDPVNGVQRQILTGHSASIRTIAFSPDGLLIASGGEDTTIILWNTAMGSINKTLLGSTGFINALAFSPNGASLASASEAGDITLWNVVTGTTVITIPVP